MPTYSVGEYAPPTQDQSQLYRAWRAHYRALGLGELRACKYATKRSRRGVMPPRR